MEPTSCLFISLHDQQCERLGFTAISQRSFPLCNDPYSLITEHLTIQIIPVNIICFLSLPLVQENDIVCGDMMPKGGMAKLTVFALTYNMQTGWWLYYQTWLYYSRILAIRMYDSEGTEYCQSMGTTDNYPCPEGAQSCGVMTYDFFPQSGERILSYSAIKYDTSQPQCTFTPWGGGLGGGWNSWADYIALYTSSGRKASLRKLIHDS